MLEIVRSASKNSLAGERSRQMDESEINKRLKNVPNYIGTYAVDELSEIKVSFFPCFLIINLDSRIGGGTHWVAVGIYANELYVCDSLGGLIPDRIKPRALINFLHIFSLTRNLFITKQLQESFSGTCALYCITFVQQMSKFNCFGEFLRLFTNNLHRNDLLIKFINK